MNFLRQSILAVAMGELGYSETPPNSNKTKYGEWYGMNRVPWCAIFVSWVFGEAEIPLDHIDTPKGMHYTPSALNYFNRTQQLTTNPEPGDLVFFDWQGDGKVDHVGIFLQYAASDKSSFYSIEGNTALGNDSNGGTVMIRKRSVAQAKFVKPRILADEI